MGRRRAGEMPRVAVVKPHNHARVRIGGRAYWLGRCPDGKVLREQQAEAARLWQQFLAEGVPPEVDAEDAGAALPADAPGDLTVGEVMDRFLEHAQAYYRREDGTTTSSVAEIRMAVRSLGRWTQTPAVSFGPKTLKAVQAQEVRLGRPRVTVNRISKTIRRAFKWAAGEELVTATVWHALQAVPAIQKGRSEAPELEPVDEVPEWVVEATLPHVSSVVAAMIMLQRWTGMRPGEVCILRPCDIDRSGEVWLYRPFRFKTDWRVGSERVVAIGPEGQRVLQPFLQRPPEAFCFSPQEAEAARAAVRRDCRRSPLTPSQAARKPKPNGQRRPREHYQSCSYRRAIERGVQTANRERSRAGRRPLPMWSPNQLRHLRAGELEEALGIEASSAVLGHSKVETTAIYARRKRQLAYEAARRMG
jgi:integrase